MTDVAALLDELAVAPSLPAAACAGRWDLFDHALEARTTGPAAGREHVKAKAEALEVCAACCQLAACTAWVESLPRNRRPYGVTAGHFRPFGPKRSPIKKAG